MASIFTKIINREIPASIVFENENVIAFKDINPQAPVHILIVPKKEIATVNDITAEDAALIGNLYLAAAEIAIELSIAEDGYRLITNCNKFGGQEVFHLHIHLMGGEPIGPMRA
ncbi:MAG: histidine triad nucleotide-binding protein [Cetobacterium sp.]